jgi:hypothetical protein
MVYGFSENLFMAICQPFLKNDFCLDHYRNRSLCRVSEALGEGWKTLGKACDTRQRELDEQYIGNDIFVEYFLSGSRQRKATVTMLGNRDDVFAECSR